MHELTVFCEMFRAVTLTGEIFNNPRIARKFIICVNCKKS